MLKKFFAALLCASLVMNVQTAVVSASNPPEQTIEIGTELEPRFDYFSGVTADLFFTGSIANCTGKAIIFDDSDVVYELTITLKRSTDQRNWSTVKSWTTSKEGPGAHIVSGQYAVLSGYYYQVWTTYNVWDGNDIVETATPKSMIVKK